ncbi:MAG: dihydroorotase [Candidatus Binatia bacterium]|nr:dihydroorotase [Candidatus Binatia bacterium]
MKIVIYGGTVIDPANDLAAPRDVLIEDGVIRAVVPPQSGLATGDMRIDASGLIVAPGLIDMHVHLREPGYEYKETVLTGTQAAVAGGFTAVACMANTNPVNDNGAVTRYIRERAQAANLARVFPIGALSKGLRGEELAEIGEMVSEGIVAVSDDGCPVMDTHLMRRALEYCSMFHLPISVHEEDSYLAAGGVMNEGPTALRLGLKGIPNAAEEVMVARDIALARLTGGRLHIAHVSTKEAVALIRQAKAEGLPVTAEVTPHHFTLTESAVEGYNTNAKMAPPLRSLADVEAVKEGLRDGTIDVIATDHAPHHRDEKEVEFDQAAHGVVGLETALPLALRLVHEGVLSLPDMLRTLTVNPARILGLPYGTLSPGAPADIVIFDPHRRWTVEARNLRSKSKNTPFDGWDLTGKVLWTLVQGRVVYAEEEADRRR